MYLKIPSNFLSVCGRDLSEFPEDAKFIYNRKKNFMIKAYFGTYYKSLCIYLHEKISIFKSDYYIHYICRYTIIYMKTYVCVYICIHTHVQTLSRNVQL